jgi:phage terminase large subunit
VTDAERVRIPHGLELLDHQQAVIAARHAGARWRLALHHRQSGKDITGLVDIASAAFTDPGVYGYIAPTYSMVRRIAWDGVRASDGLPYLDVIPSALVLDRNEAEMSLTIRSQHEGKVSRIHFLSGDRPDRLRGLPFKGVVFTEYAQFEGSTAFDIVKPALMGSGGWALVITTPLGIGNHFHRLWTMAQGAAEWWTDVRTIEQTRYRDGRRMISPDAIAEELRNGQRREWLDQEYYCQFVAGLISSIFGDVLTAAQKDDRIGEVPHRPDRPVVTAWDLGVDDATVIIYVQPVGDMFHVIDVDEFSGLTLAGLIARVKAHTEYNVQEWYAPHDLRNRDFSATGGADGQAVTREQVARRLGVRFTIAPKLGLADGLDAVRRMLSRFRFDQRKCGKLLEAISEYRRTWDPERKVYSDKPLHDWSSHYCDALRTFVTGYRERSDDREHRPPSVKGSLTYAERRPS